MQMKDLNDLYYFAKVVEYGGFSSASLNLGITKSLLSRRIVALEERLGVKLLNRTTRKVAMTEIGKIYYQHCQAMLVEAESADEAIQRLVVEPKGVVKISCPTNLLHINVSEMLNRFLAQYPKIQLHVESTNRQVDLINEAYDFAIRVRPFPLKDSDLVVRSLAVSQQLIVASPDLLHQHYSIQRPEEMTRFPILMMEPFSTEYAWKLYNQNNDLYQLKAKPRLTTTDLQALHAATIAGLGLAKLPDLMIAEDLKQGRLMKVLPEWAPKAEVVHLAYTSKRGMLPSVKALIEFLVDAFEKHTAICQIDV